MLQLKLNINLLVTNPSKPVKALKHHCADVFAERGAGHKPLKACEGSETCLGRIVDQPAQNGVTNPSKPVKALKLSSASAAQYALTPRHKPLKACEGSET